MRAFALMLLVAACVPVLVQAKIYKWVLPDGSVQYSDRPPQEGGKPVDLPPLQIYASPPPPPPPAPAGERSGASQVEGYDVVKVKSPQPGEVIRDNGAGELTFEVELAPRLRPGHTLDILFDGKSIGSGRSTSANVANVDRGSHTVSAVIKDASGKQVAQAEPVTFEMKKVSKLLPARPAP